MDKMIYDNREYDLAVNNMKMARLIDKAEKSTGMLEAYTNELEVVKAAVGSEVAQELLGTLNIEEIDLTTLVLIYNAVIDGYESRIHELQKEKELKLVNTPTVKAVKDMADQVKVIKSATEK